jgi:hypothetical protein
VQAARQPHCGQQGRGGEEGDRVDRDAGGRARRVDDETGDRAAEDGRAVEPKAQQRVGLRRNRSGMVWGTIPLEAGKKKAVLVPLTAASAASCQTRA